MVTKKRKFKASTWIIIALSLSILFLMQYSCEEEMHKINTQQLLEKSIRQQIMIQSGNAHYFIKWFDLNLDGNKEAIVHVTGSSVCQKKKCNTYVFSWDSLKEDYLQIGKVKSSLPPIIASPRKSKGWYNLYLYQDSSKLRSNMIGLTFNGKRYMTSKNIPSEMQDVDSPFGAPLLLPYVNYLDGLPLFNERDTEE